MACLFFQVDPRNERVILFDEIVGSKMTLEVLWDKINKKNYNISQWYCDISGKQTREQSGFSNIEWFRERGVHFRYRKSNVADGIALVRSYTKNVRGVRRFYVVRGRADHSIDGMINYSYQERNGMIEETPQKVDDDCVDSIRYFFMCHLDPKMQGPQHNNFNRWSW